MSFTSALSAVLKIEGGYVNDPTDRGGETNFGITLATARRHGYVGPMRDMPREVAAEIYCQEYWTGVGLDGVSPVDEGTAEILFDIAVNMGTGTAQRFLQRSLNLMNRNASMFPDLIVDGDVGITTIKALRTLAPGDLAILRKIIRSYQAARYLSIIEGDPTQERFTRGWFIRLASNALGE
jgi:lysozyme family protein